MANRRRDGGREAYWRGVLRRQAASGQSVRAFCRRERLSEPSFYAWRRTLRERDAVARPSPRGPSPCGSSARRPSPRRPSPRRPSAPRPAFLPATILPAAMSSPTIRATSLPAGAIVIELLGGRSLKLPESMAPARVAALIHALEGAHGATEVRP